MWLEVGALFKRKQHCGHVFAELAVLKAQLDVALERQSELEEENKVSVAMMIPVVSRCLLTLVAGALGPAERKNGRM